MKKFALVAALTLGFAGFSNVQAGDAAAGQQKATNKGCIACHGVDGNSIAPNYPNLAGQLAPFLSKQLLDFKEGRRQDPIMSGQAAGLTQEDMDDIAAFFSSQKIKSGLADPDWVKEGEKIYKGGIASVGAPACMGCHGPTGEGNPGSGFPVLHSQKADYIEKALKDFRAAAQNLTDKPVGRSNDINRVWMNDVNRMMRNAVERMNDQEIKAVAQYIQGLQP